MGRVKDAEFASNQQKHKLKKVSFFCRVFKIHSPPMNPHSKLHLIPLSYPIHRHEAHFHRPHPIPRLHSTATGTDSPKELFQLSAPSKSTYVPAPSQPTHYPTLPKSLRTSNNEEALTPIVLPLAKQHLGEPKSIRSRIYSSEAPSPFHSNSRAKIIWGFDNSGGLQDLPSQRILRRPLKNWSDQKEKEQEIKP